MKTILTILFGTLITLRSVTIPCQAEGVFLEIQPGAFFIPTVGEPRPLYGNLIFGDEFQIDVPSSGISLTAQKLTGLYFVAGDLQFRLHDQDSGRNFTFARPGSSSSPITWSLNAIVDAQDADRVILGTGFSLRGISATSSPPASGMEFPALDLYRNFDSENPELIGSFSFAAAVVPEPGPILLTSIAAFMWCVYRRRSPSAS